MKNFNHKPTKEEMRELWDAVTEWIALYQPSCEESIYQVDKVQEGLPELGGRVCEVVGYYPYEEE